MKTSLDRLLYMDGFAALTAGIFLLLLRDFLSGLLGLPVWLLTAQGFINIAYSAYSLPLARRKYRPGWMVQLLAVANMLYAFGCVPLLLWHFFPTCNALGVAYFGLEIGFIGGLGWLEWRALKAN
ncbi:MAG: hypothetical protein ACKV1O_17455 [Saprospiraceae bacterium]